MKHRTALTLSLAACAAGLVGSAEAQTITPLIGAGDALPNGLVTAIYNVDVNNVGSWLVELDTDNPDTAIDNAVVLNGTMIHQEGSSMGFPASHSSWFYKSYVDSMDINDNGDRLLLFNVGDSTGISSDRKLILWTNGATGATYPILEEHVTPCTVAGEPAGALWDSIAEVWQNNNDTIVIAGRSDTDTDDMMAVISHDGAGNILSQTVFVMDGVIHSTQFPGSTGTHLDTVQTLGVSKQNFSINNAGQKMFFVDDQSYGVGGTPDYTTVDAHYYIDLNEIAWEGSDAPTPGSWPYNHMSSAEVDLNDSGSWVAVWDDDNSDTTQDFFIVRDGVVFAQEGQAPPGIAGSFVMTGAAWGGVQLSEAGDITWYCDWDDPDTTIDSGLFRNTELLIQEGVTMIGGVPVDTISSSADGMACSDNGYYIVIELTLSTGAEGAYMIEVAPGTAYCFGDGSGAACPCANLGGPGEGCANGTGAGGILSATGSASVSLGNLSLDVAQCPSGQPGLLFQGLNATGGGLGSIFGDGLRCAGGSVVRLETVFLDGGGSGSSSVNISAKGGVSSGDTRYYQFWYRDPAGSPCGALFNLTNGLELNWGL
jgi:hypothetical protein